MRELVAGTIKSDWLTRLARSGRQAYKAGRQAFKAGRWAYKAGRQAKSISLLPTRASTSKIPFLVSNSEYL